MRFSLPILTAAFALALPFAAFAVGSDDSSSPKPTETTQTCDKGMVWDAKSGKCVNPQSGSLDDETLHGAVREFAYAGQYRHALDALDAIADQQDDRVTTYRGFVARKMGDMEGGMAFYRAALDANPDNLLARSYMGQAFVEQGDTAAARAQLTEIRARGGEGSWAEAALFSAIVRGTTYSY
ncbi:tetratricopeptide repeat protein [Tropicimonas aquimaris]|uniref:Tetratricopeptide repeat protein n=1 Tax=Tropicimonas aquimaris TaxID=914152 RepID=A0ABW3ILT3_9RHOB